MTTIKIADAFDQLLKQPLPLRFTAYDGSASGPEDAPYGFDLRNERGLAYLMTAPGDLGLGRRRPRDVRRQLAGDLGSARGGAGGRGPAADHRHGRPHGHQGDRPLPTHAFPTDATPGDLDSAESATAKPCAS